MVNSFYKGIFLSDLHFQGSSPLPLKPVALGLDKGVAQYARRAMCSPAGGQQVGRERKPELCPTIPPQHSGESLLQVDA